MTERLRSWELAATLMAAWLAAVFFLWPGEKCLPAGAVSSACFLLSPWLFARLAAGGLRLSPVTWLRFAFGLQLVVVPACVRVVGASQFLLKALPSSQAQNMALLLDTCGFLAFCAGFELMRGRGTARHSAPSNDLSWLPTRRLSWVFLLLGCGGLLLKFGSVGHLVTYMTDPIEFLSGALDGTTEATAGEAAGTFLCAFLGFGCVMLWCRAVDLPRCLSGRWTELQRFALIGLIALAYALMSYNRGAVAVPLVTAAAVVGKRQPGAGVRYAMVIAGTLGVLLTGLTVYRSLNSAAAEGGGAAVLADAGSYLDLMGTFQVYGQAPQFLAAALTATPADAGPLLGRTVVSSVLAPVPVLGKGLRATSGMMLYNEALGRGDAADQIPQLTYELYRDFNVPGVLGGFVLLGLVTALLERGFADAGSAMEVYVLQYCAVWLGFLTVGGLDVIAQIAIYSAPPVYVYLLLRRWVARRARRGAGQGAVRGTVLVRLAEGGAR